MNSKYVIMLMVVFVFASCQGLRHSDFSKRKYLKLEPCKSEVVCASNEVTDTPHFISDLKAENTGPVLQLAPEELPVIGQEDSAQVDLTGFNAVGRIEKQEISSKGFFADPPGKSTDDLAVSETAKDPSYLFKSGCMMLLLAFLLTGMAFTASTIAMLFVYLTIAAGLFIATWIISIFLVRKLRAVPASERSDTMQVQFILAMIVNVIGWTILVANVILWLLILLFLLA